MQILGLQAHGITHSGMRWIQQSVFKQALHVTLMHIKLGDLLA